MANKVENYCHYSDLPSPNAYIPNKYPPTVISNADIDRIIGMAWEDRTPFEAIEVQFGLKESAVKQLMKNRLKFSSYKLWRTRVEKCFTKHLSKRAANIDRFKSKLQRNISNNKISKRR
jgi:uncharacterized protein (TIGR03643 family)